MHRVASDESLLVKAKQCLKAFRSPADLVLCPHTVPAAAAHYFHLHATCTALVNRASPRARRALVTGAADELRGPPSFCSPARKAACPTGQAQCCWILASQGAWFGSDSIGQPPPLRLAGRWNWWKSSESVV